MSLAFRVSEAHATATCIRGCARLPAAGRLLIASVLTNYMASPQQLDQGVAGLVVRLADDEP